MLPQQSSRYRPDIDGLRAIAVLAVILFHCAIPRLGSGGFVGVDVFFVISGYLITSLLRREPLDRNSLAQFYERRARRLLPALLVVLAASIPLAFMLLPGDLQAFGKTLASVAAFSSNVLFWRGAGYFDSSSELKPLLHTWSLAIEEQFYLLYPLCLALLLKGFGARAHRALFGLMVVSLLASIWAVTATPASAFYLLPFRAWELLLGGLLALWPALPGDSRTHDLAGATGLAMVLGSIFMFSPSTPFPGWYALAPCVGAALIIHGGSHPQSRTRKMLGSSLLVRIGLVSYSLYLWHWVVLAFARYRAIRELTLVETAAAVAVSLVLATITTRYVEAPFRTRRALKSSRALFTAAALGSIAVFAIGAALWLARGFPERASPRITALTAAWNDLADSSREVCKASSRKATPPAIVSPCPIGIESAGDLQVVLWGDSHSIPMAPVISELARARGLSGAWISFAGCPPLLGIHRYDPGQAWACAESNRTVPDFIRRHHVRTVIVASRWALYVEGIRNPHESGQGVLLAPSRRHADNHDLVARSLATTLQELSALGVQTYLIASVPEIGFDVPSTLARGLWFGRPLQIGPTREEFETRQLRTFAMLKRAANLPGVHILWPHEILCSRERCEVQREGRPLYVDDDHLSRAGVAAIRDLLAAIPL